MTRETATDPECVSLESVDALIAAVFAADHARDVDAFVALLSASVTFRFGGAPLLEGRDAVATMVRALFAQVQGIDHRLVHRWVDGSEIAYAGQVTFTFRDDRLTVLPYVNTLRLGDGGLVADYRIHIDPTPLNSAGG